MFYVIGGTAAQSAANFEQWLENIMCGMSTIVIGPNGKEPRLYHHVLLGDFQQITGPLSQATRQWSSDCIANNCTCGCLFYVTGSWQGMLSISYQVMGPFI